MPLPGKCHDPIDPKRNWIPSGVTQNKIIGYTGDLHGKKNDRPTVYFTCGHFTQAHGKKWNEGWESYEGWECKFFGNVPDSDQRKPRYRKRGTGKANSTREINGRMENIPTDEYVKTLKTIGKNRIKRPNTADLASWNLSRLGDENKDYVLREVWIKEKTNGDVKDSRFAHPSRHWFTPVNDEQTRANLWRQVYTCLPLSQKIRRYFG
jgi:hypothetical protein